MSFGRLDDSLWRHRAWQALSPISRGDWATLVSWCCDQGNSGRFLIRDVERLIDYRLSSLEELEREGFVDPIPVDQRSKYGEELELHNFMRWNPKGDQRTKTDQASQRGHKSWTSGGRTSYKNPDCRKCLMGDKACWSCRQAALKATGAGPELEQLRSSSEAAPQQLRSSPVLRSAFDKSLESKPNNKVTGAATHPIPSQPNQQTEGESVLGVENPIPESPLSPKSTPGLPEGWEPFGPNTFDWLWGVGIWPAADTAEHRDSYAKCQAAFNSNITADVWPAFARALDARITAFHQDRSRDRRKILGGLRTFIESRWRDYQLQPAPPAVQQPPKTLAPAPSILDLQTSD